MAVKREEFCAAYRPVVFDDDMPAKIGGRFVGHGFADLTGEHGENFVVGNERRFVACEIFAGSAVGEDDAGGLVGRRDVDRRNVAAAMEPPATVACPARLAEVRVNAGAGEELFQCGEELLVWRRPGDDDLLVGR